MEFLYESQGHTTYLTYEISSDDMMDTMSLGMITNNKISGLAPCIFMQRDLTQYIKYNVSSKITVRQFFTGSVKKNQILGVFKGIVSAILEAEDYMLEPDSILLDLDYIFVDVSNCDVAMICLPVQRGELQGQNLHDFFKNIIFGTQTDQTENCDYVAKIINYLNASSSFSLEGFKSLLDTLSAPASAPKGNTSNATPQPVPPMRAPTPQAEKRPEKPQVAPVPEERPIIHQSGPVQPSVTSGTFHSAPTSVINNNPSTPAKVPTNLQNASSEKKKSGMFGFLSKKEKQNPEPQPKQPQSAPAKQGPYGFAIPGQPSAQTVQMAQPAPQPSARPNPAKPAPAPQPASAPPRQPAYQPPVQPQGKVGNFGETTVLGGGGGIGETTVLNAVAPNQTAAPYLIRMKNNEKIPLNKPVFRIGKERSYVDYFIGDNTAVSRSHANIEIKNGEYFVMDTNSTNHTYVNGTMIPSNASIKINPGDKIRLANEDFEFVLS